MPQIIQVQQLTKHYVASKRHPGFWGWFKKDQTVREAVKGVSFTLEEGEMVGFIGPNGAGKTTTLKMLSGILYPTKGEATVMGFIPWERPKDYRQQFSIIMGQRNQLWWELPPLDTFRLHQALYAIPDAIFQARLDELVTLLDITHVIHVPTRNLSLGERMKCEIVASLLHAPKILFLDEPTIGLDVVSQRKIREFLRMYNAKYWVTILLTSHYMQDVESLCERVIMIDDGKIVYDGSVALLKQEYAEEKDIRLTFTEFIPQDKLASYGKVVNYDDGFSATVRVHHQEVREKTARILSELPVQDITISEESLESVIASLFLKKS